MLPVIAIVGRPNVGKSTLFNFLSHSRDALVADQPGVTRDRQYARTSIRDKPVLLVDTGGLDEGDINDPLMSEIVTRQSLHAAQEADAVIWLLDGRDGLTTMDEKLATMLRPVCKHLFVVVNKTEGLDSAIALADFHVMGMKPFAVSAQRGSGLPELLEQISRVIPRTGEAPEIREERLTISIIGRPNVGKSTLVNRILGEERMLIYDQPGTTRDAIRIPFEKNNEQYELIDTAGVRRRAKIDDQVEKISVIKTLQVIEQSQIIVLVLDAHDTVADQDATLLGLCIDSGKALMIAVNKWDGLEDSERKLVLQQLDRKLGFIDYACIHTISALHGSGVGKLFTSFRNIKKSLLLKPSTSRLTDLLSLATSKHTPPLVQGRRIKLRYAHVGGHEPLRIIIHGNQVDKISESYRRYLSNYFRKALKMTGAPVAIEFRQGSNPFQGRKNTLTRRQVNKRQRLHRHNKKGR